MLKQAYFSWFLESRVFLSLLLFWGMGSLLGNVPHSASQTFLVFGEQLFFYLTGDSSLPAVFLTTWLILEAFQAFASFLTASSLPLVKSKSCIRRFKISSSLLRLSKMICWSPLISFHSFVWHLWFHSHSV